MEKLKEEQWAQPEETFLYNSVDFENCFTYAFLHVSSNPQARANMRLKV